MSKTPTEESVDFICYIMSNLRTNSQEAFTTKY